MKGRRERQTDTGRKSGEEETNKQNWEQGRHSKAKKQGGIWN